jgi:outer membrane lipase/esterase
MRFLKPGLLAAAIVLAVSGCGGGGSDTTPSANISSVQVFGDSLADSGTFGIKFTVQGSDVQIYPERVAALYGQTLCPYFVATGTSTFTTNTTAGCTNYAIGGGVINYTSSTTNPLDITVQLATAGAAGFVSTDLLVVDGGGNDAAALIADYLAASSDSGASYVTLISSLLTTTQVGTAVAGGTTGLQAAGVTYMQALADRLYTAISEDALANGATRVVVLNMPAVTKTPRFQTVLAAITAAQGATASAGAEALFDGWIQAFNAELATKFASESRVTIVDFYTSLKAEVAYPAQYGLTNATTPACPATGTDSSGLPTYTFATCTEDALSASPPTGVTDPDWWKTYGFSDSFHPTPYGHQLLAQLISRSLAIKGWL